MERVRVSTVPAPAVKICTACIGFVAPHCYSVTRLVPAPVSIPFRKCFNAFLPAISVLFLILFTQRIARRSIGDALVGQRRLGVGWSGLRALALAI